jgi:hypothetical protein
MGVDCYIFDSHSRQCASLDRIRVFQAWHYDHDGDGARVRELERLSEAFSDYKTGLIESDALAYLRTLLALRERDDERDYDGHWLKVAIAFVAARPGGCFFVVPDCFSWGGEQLDCYDVRDKYGYATVAAPEPIAP